MPNVMKVLSVSSEWLSLRFESEALPADGALSCDPAPPPPPLPPLAPLPFWTLVKKLRSSSLRLKAFRPGVTVEGAKRSRT